MVVTSEALDVNILSEVSGMKQQINWYNYSTVATAAHRQREHGSSFNHIC